MNIRFEFAFVVILCIVPFIIKSLLEDLSIKVVAVVAAILAYTCALYMISSSVLGFWPKYVLGTNSDAYATATGVIPVLLCFQTYRIYVRRRSFETMNWPADAAQAVMERQVVKILRRDKWAVSRSSSFGGITIFDCQKASLRVFIVFVKEPIPFDDLRQSIAKYVRSNTDKLVITHYRKPTETMKQASLASGFVSIHYKDLARIDEVGDWVYKRIAEVRVAKRIAQTKKDLDARNEDENLALGT